MARKPSSTDIQKSPEVDLATVAAGTNALDVLSIAKADHSETRDVVNQILGQVQMAQSFARFADVVSLTKLKHVKESKLYRAIAGKKAFDPDGVEIADVGTWEGFCQALGLSRSKVDEDLKNLSVFGEVALNNLSSIGIGYRELRQYRKLPEDQKTALIEAAQTGDKDAFLELAEDLIAKHAKEKDALSKRVEDLQSSVTALERLNDDKNKKLDELATRQATVDPWDEKVGQFKTEIAGGFDLLDDTVGRLWLIHAAILKDGVTWGGDEDAERVILRQFAVLFHDRLNRAAQQLAELCNHHEATLAGWAGELEGHALQDHTGAPDDGEG